MVIKLERLRDLFDEDIIGEMIDIVTDEGVCHWNAAMMCVQFSDWKCMTYCEGYKKIFSKGVIGHAINGYTDGNGVKHYIDVTTEAYIAKGWLTEDYWVDEFDLIKEVSTEEVVEDNNKKGYSELHYVNVSR